MRRTVSLAALVALIATLSVAAPTLAQRGQRRGSGMGRDQGFSGRQMVNRSFEAVAPGIGESMPDIIVHDERGNAIALRQLLSGHYSVVVLGCLT